MKDHLKLLGKRGKDVVTGFAGVITSLSFDLYGCIQCVITPAIDEKGETKQGIWFDVARIEIINETPVMKLPDFEAGDIAKGEKGCEDKPIP